VSNRSIRWLAVGLAVLIISAVIWTLPYPVPVVWDMFFANMDSQGVDARLKAVRSECESTGEKEDCLRSLSLLNAKVRGYRLLTKDRVEALAKANMSPEMRKRAKDRFMGQLEQSLDNVNKLRVELFSPPTR
jgi:hypothetical protein